MYAQYQRYDTLRAILETVFAQMWALLLMNAALFTVTPPTHERTAPQRSGVFTCYRRRKLAIYLHPICTS